MSNLIAFSGLLLLVLYVEADRTTDNFKVFEVVPRTQDELEAIRSLEQSDRAPMLSTINFLKEPSALGNSIDIMVGSKDMIAFNQYLSQHNIQAKVVVNDVLELVEEERRQMNRISARAFRPGSANSSFAIDNYHSVKEIYSWVDSLVAKYPKLVSTESIGKSFEKRDMRLVKIGTGGKTKPGYWIDAGIHAQEWITVSTAVYIINELVTKYDSNPTYKKLLDKLDFFILPVTNPDGYEYSRKGLKERTWRKTRSPQGHTYGVDPNRNFDFHWIGPDGGSSNPSSDLYRGPKPFSESECLNVANYLKSHNKTLKSYVSLHSFGNYFVYPYAYKNNTYPSDVENLKALAQKAAAAIKAVHDAVFKVGPVPHLIYVASGSSMDYAKGIANIKYSYTLELRGAGSPPIGCPGYGFVLCPCYIIPVAEETWAGLQVIAEKISDG